MRIPNEQQTREFFSQLGFFMEPLDRSKRPYAVRVHFEYPDSPENCEADWESPSLKHAWESWAESASSVREECALVDAVMDRWRGATHQERRAIERWVESYGRSPWAKRFQEIENAMPLRPLCLRDMPRGWRHQFIIDMKSRRGTDQEELALSGPLRLHEYIRSKMMVEQSAMP